MRKVMRNVILLAAFCAAVPLFAQDQPAPLSQQPPKPQAPALEQPGTAAPEPAKKPAEIKKPTEDKKPTEAKIPVEAANARTVEEIIARVNNEIITRSELDKARAAAKGDATQEYQAESTPGQYRAHIRDRQKNTFPDLIDQSLLV